MTHQSHCDPRHTGGCDCVPRYTVIEQPPSELAMSYGLDHTLYIVWDNELDRRAPFGAHRTTEGAHAHISRILAREAGERDA